MAAPSIEDDRNTAPASDSLEQAIKELENERLQVRHRHVLGQKLVVGYDMAIDRGGPWPLNTAADAHVGKELQKAARRRGNAAKVFADAVDHAKATTPVRGYMPRLTLFDDLPSYLNDKGFIDFSPEGLSDGTSGASTESLAYTD